MVTSAVAETAGIDVATYAPMVYLYPYAESGDPVYDPCSVEWFLDGGATGQGVTLTRQDGTSYTPAAGQPFDQSQLLADQEPGNAVGIALDEVASSPIRAGNLASAVAYAHRRPVGPTGVTDIQYWLFYAIRGMSTARFIVVSLLGVPVNDEIDMDLLAPAGQPYLGAGEHQGDFKHATVRVDADGNILGVFYAQHNGGFWCLPGSFQLGQGTSQPVVYSSRNTHSCLPATGMSTQLNTLHDDNARVIDFQIGLLEHTSGARAPWNCATGCVDMDAAPPAWLAFDGYWGLPVAQAIAPAAFAPVVAALARIVPLNSAEKTLIEVAIQAAAQGFAGTEQGGATPSLQGPWLNGDQGNANWTSGPDKRFDSGATPDVSLRSDGLALQVHASGDSASGLYYSVAKLNPLELPMTWPATSQSYDSGTAPAVDLNDNDLAVEVHTSLEAATTLAYNLFTVSDGTLARLAGGDYDTGLGADVALNNHDVVLEVHQASDGSPELSYNLGAVESGAIVWNVKSQPLGAGQHPSVALDDNGTAVVVSQDSHANLQWTLYTVTTGGLTLLAGPTTFDTGTPASVALNNNGVVLVVHQSSNHDLDYNLGRLDLQQTPAKISFTTSSGTGYDTGAAPAVALNDYDLAVEIHQGHASLDLYSQYSMV